jgi:hypothetical protein
LAVKVSADECFVYPLHERVVAAEKGEVLGIDVGKR